MPSVTTLLRTACVALALVAARSAPVCAADIVLRFGSVNTEGTAPYDQALVPFARAVEEESGGRIEVALKPVGGYGKPAELFNMVERGDIEMAATVQGYNPGRFPESSVISSMSDTPGGKLMAKARPGVMVTNSARRQIRL